MITPNRRSLRLVRIIFTVSVFLLASSLRSAPSPTPTPPGTIDEKFFNGMRWRQVGPFRGGRALAIEGVVGEPDTYYFGAVARGVFRTTDGGKTWAKVLSKDENTGGIDIVFDPHNPNIVFASLWQARRQPWFFSSGGPGSGLYRSEDNGVTWKRLEGNGLPSGILGKIGVAVSGADSNRVYAIIEAKEGGLYRSDDAGQHWTRANDDGRFR